jgi:carbamate kinase
MIQRALYNEFQKRKIVKPVSTVVTLVRVDTDDPAFKKPDKPIGTFLEEQEAKLRAQTEGWAIKEDAGRGWRRVVPSPIPKEIIELPVIKSLIGQGVIVYAVGGGGIPVIRKPNGDLEGVAAVIDKDRASALLASDLNADVLIISTAVEKAYLNFGKPKQKAIDKMDLVEAQRYVDEGHFAAGSMLPKIEACIDFIKKGGQLAIITDPPNIMRALRGETGTRVVPAAKTTSAPSKKK